KGFWILGTSAKEGVKLYEFDLLRPLVLIMGSESRGISPVLKRIVDSTLRIPGTGPLDSLNVSVATGVILYEIWRQKSSRV
ncbi:MAG: TrmH family RNA methyltransferase, partial [Desulfatiglandales bacterium]